MNHLDHQHPLHAAADQEMAVDDLNDSYTTMAVVDGIVMSPPHCAYDDCISELANSRGGSFCALHEHLHGAKCRVKNCNVQKVAGTQACQRHQEQWNNYVYHHHRQKFGGARRMLQRQNEQLPWLPTVTSHMMSLLLMFKETIISLQITSTVWKHMCSM